MTPDMKKSLEIAHKARQSLQRAVDHVVAEHGQTGEPLIVSQHGRMIRKKGHAWKTGRILRQSRLRTRHHGKLNRSKHSAHPKSVEA